MVGWFLKMPPGKDCVTVWSQEIVCLKKVFVHTIVCHIAGIHKHHNTFQSEQSNLNDF